MNKMPQASWSWRAIALAGVLVVVLCGALLLSIQGKHPEPIGEDPGSLYRQGPPEGLRSQEVFDEDVATQIDHDIEDHLNAEMKAHDEKIREQFLRAEIAKRAEDFQAQMRPIWEREDATLRTMPAYSDVESVFSDRAVATVAEAGIDWQNSERIQELVQQHVNAFWEKDGLLAPTAYEDAYLARAITERALEYNPDSFELLDSLRDVLGATHVLYSADGVSYDLHVGELWDASERQRRVMLADKRAPDFDGYCLMHDWILLATIRSPSQEHEGWQWLIDNADTGGWQSQLDTLRKGREGSSDDNRMIMGSPYVPKEKPDAKEQAFRSRRLVSYRGSDTMQENTVSVLDPRRKSVTTRTTVAY